ncbi:MAG: hypothetical protein CTY16_14760 [Methylobacter sp.]|nr:MAG: hypothetical protein CTY16_14760 [Methylobacter sp.]
MRANSIYEEPRYGGENNHGHKTGKELLAESQRGAKFFVGRNGGLKGKLLKDDVNSGKWKAQRYETSMSETEPNQNWFSLSDFIAAVSSANNGD